MLRGSCRVASLSLVQGRGRFALEPDTAINALRDESMLLAYLQGDRPICTKVSVRPIEEPEGDHQTHHTRNERAGAQRVLSERERWRRDPDQGDQESDPGENQEARL